MAPAVCVHTSRFAQAPGRDGKGVGIFSFAGKGGGRSSSGGSGGCPGLAPPTLPGAGRRGKKGGEMVALAVLLCHLVGCWPCSPSGKNPSGAGDTNATPCNTPARP